MVQKNSDGTRSGSSIFVAKTASKRYKNAPEDGATGLNLLEMVDGRASDVAIHVQENWEALELLTHQEAQCSQHGYSTCVSHILFTISTSDHRVDAKKRPFVIELTG